MEQVDSSEASAYDKHIKGFGSGMIAIRERSILMDAIPLAMRYISFDRHFDCDKGC